MNVYVHLTTLLLASIAAAATLVAIWAATSRRHWFWRALAIWACVATMIPIRAHEPALVFGIGLPLTVGLLWVGRLLKRQRASRDEQIRFGLRDLFLALLIIGMSLALVRLAIPSGFQLTVYEILVPPTALAGLTVSCYWLVVGPRRIWAFGLVLVAITLDAFLLWPRVTWLDDIATLGLAWDRAGMAWSPGLRSYFTAIRVFAVGLVEYVALCTAFLCLLKLSRPGGPYALVAKVALASIFVAWGAVGCWMFAEMLPMAAFPPPLKGSSDHGAEIVQIAARVHQLGPRKPDFKPKSASVLPASTGTELVQLYYIVVPLLDAGNSIPFDPLVDLTRDYFRDARSRHQWLRELCICFDAECREAESAGDRGRSLNMAIANLRLGTMCCQNGTSIDAQVGSAFLGVPFKYFARSRETFDLDETERIRAAITRMEGELEPIDSIQQRDLAYSQREYGWQGRLSAFVARGEAEKMSARAVQLTRDRWHAMSRLLLTDLAIRRYERDHGSWPKSLEQLVPQYLGELPIDPYSNKPFRYLSGDDDFMLYSAGPDRVDNGGRFSDGHGFYGHDGYDIDLDSLLP